MLDLKNENVKKGAVDALNIILISRKRKIRVNTAQDDNQKKDDIPELKLPKNSEVISEDNDGEMGENEPKDDNERESDEERQGRIDRLNRLANNAEEIENELANIALDKNEREEKIARASKEAARKAAEKSGRSINGIQDFSQFERDLSRAMKKQTTETSKPEDTYSKVNPTYAKSDLLMPGRGYAERRTIPIINVYWDESGSLRPNEIKQGRNALSKLLKLEQRKKIKVKNYWFADNVVNSPEDAYGGTGAFPSILEHIQATKATNVIIFTDSDFNYQTKFNSISPIKINGCVWWIWAGGIADRAVPYIKPRLKSNVFEYRLR